ncbi:transmembrane protein [Cystoisospora suis]|uniref:Transmembrane protein n=1 Tax=Cystoisospora suis TaxID=483139 RepID=A0A2C6L8Q4_9APIC|nr:transmembrane protein [Cystoisospora suis]
MAAMPFGRLLLPWRLSLFRRRPRLFFFLCGAGCTYTAVNGSNPLSVVPLCCCYSYDLVALACPPLQLRRALFYVSLSRGVHALGLDSPVLDKYLFLRLCSHVQQVFSAPQVSPSFFNRGSPGTPGSFRQSRLFTELKREQQLKCLYTPVPAVVDRLHHLMLSLERFYPGAESLDLQEVYSTLLPTLILLGREERLQQVLKVSLFSQLSPEKIHIFYNAPSFFSVAPSTGGPFPSSSLSRWWDGSRFFSGSAATREAFNHMIASSSSSSFMQEPHVRPFSTSASTTFRSSWPSAQYQHNRLLLQLLHLNLLSTTRTLQFNESLAYDKARPPLELPPLLSPRVLLDASKVSFSSPGGGAEGVFSDTSLSSVASLRASGPPHVYRDVRDPLESDWASALTGVQHTGGALLQAALEQWRCLMTSVSGDLAEVAVSRSRRARGGSCSSPTSTASPTARLAGAGAAEPRTLVGVIAAGTSFLLAPFVPTISPPITRSSLSNGNAEATDPAGILLDELGRASISAETTSGMTSKTSDLTKDHVSSGSLFKPLQDQLLQLQYKQQRRLITLSSPGSMAAGVVELWKQLEDNRGLGRRVHTLLWGKASRQSLGRGSSRGEATSSVSSSSSTVSLAADLHARERLLIAAVRRSLDDLNWPGAASCLSPQQMKLLNPADSSRLEKLRYMFGSHANAAVRTPHRMHSYDKNYDDFSTRFWLWKQLQRLRDGDYDERFLGCCILGAAAALGGVFLLFFLRSRGGTGKPESGGVAPGGLQGTYPSTTTTTVRNSSTTHPATQNSGFFKGMWGGLKGMFSRGATEEASEVRTGENPGVFLPPSSPSSFPGQQDVQLFHQQLSGALDGDPSSLDQLLRSTYEQQLRSLYGDQASVPGGYVPDTRNVDPNAYLLPQGGEHNFRGGPADIGGMNYAPYGLGTGGGRGLGSVEAAGLASRSGPAVFGAGGGSGGDLRAPGSIYSGRQDLTSLYLALTAAGRGPAPK